MYSASGYIVDASDFICGTYIPINAHQIFSYVTCMSNLVSTFISDTFVAITCEVDVAVLVFWHIYTKLLNLCAHLACWLCELHYKYGGNIYCNIC